jgi:hypothetical protein
MAKPAGDSGSHHDVRESGNRQANPDKKAI